MSYVIKHKKTGMYAGPDGSRALALRFDTYGEAARELGCFTVKNDWLEHARIFYLGRKRKKRGFGCGVYCNPDTGEHTCEQGTPGAKAKEISTRVLSPDERLRDAGSATHTCKGLRRVEGPARAEKAEAKVQDLAAHIRRLEEELGHAPEGSGAV